MQGHRKAKGTFRSPNQGFTLIELLVVIAIIAILASLLLPALAKAKGKSKSIACLANVKQWRLAFWMYEEDNDDYFPYEGMPAALDDPQNLNAWYNSTAQYLSQQTLLSQYQQGRAPARGDKSIFVCPSATNGTAPTLAKPIFFYGFNNYMDPNGPAQFKRTEVRYLADTITFTENDEQEYPSTWGAFTPALHDQRANLAFADGHAAPVPYADFHRKTTENNSAIEFSKSRKVYWWPYPGAPN